MKDEPGKYRTPGPSVWLLQVESAELRLQRVSMKCGVKVWLIGRLTAIRMVSGLALGIRPIKPHALIPRLGGRSFFTGSGGAR